MTDENLVFNARDLSDFIEEVNDGERHFNDFDLELVKHPSKLADTKVQEVYALRLNFILLVPETLLVEVPFDLYISFTQILQENEKEVEQQPDQTVLKAGLLA